MNKEDRTYDEWLNRVKSTRLQPDDPQQLTETILSGVEKLPQERKTNRFLLFASWGTSIAAILLVGLFVVERVALPSYEEAPSSIPLISVTTVPVSYDDSLEQMDMQERISYIMQQKKERAKERQTFYLSKAKYMNQ